MYIWAYSKKKFFFFGIDAVSYWVKILIDLFYIFFIKRYKKQIWLKKIKDQVRKKFAEIWRSENI